MIQALNGVYAEMRKSFTLILLQSRSEMKYSRYFDKVKDYYCIQVAFSVILIQMKIIQSYHERWREMALGSLSNQPNRSGAKSSKRKLA